jgi:Ca2+-transporting ATPase
MGAVFIFTYLISLQALYQIAVLLIFNFNGKRILHLQNESREHADKIKNTFVFNAFVFCQVSWSLCNLKFQL